MKIAKIMSQTLQIHAKRRFVKAADSATEIQWVQEALKDKESSGLIFKPFKLLHEKLGDVFVNMERVQAPYYNRFQINVKNRMGKNLGHEIFSLNSQNKNIFGMFMTVEQAYRQKYKIGELMRLASIMELLENKGRQISIYSKDSAIYFHSKYKFLPNISQFENRDKILASIANEKAPDFADLAHEAKELINLVQKNKNNPAMLRELCNPTNVLAQKYIYRAKQDSSPQLKHPLSWGMDMVLTRERIVENRDFFNKLFKKHGIDYRIVENVDK